MIDGIIKADGTSRLMRATLPATYEEFRAQCAAGTQPLDVLFNAIGWSQIPTFLNKANLTQDAVAAMFGKDSGAVPNDLFAWIGQYAQHWWSVLHGQAGTGYEEKRTSILNTNSGDDGTTDEKYYITYWGYGTNKQTLKYSKSVSIDQSSGVVSLNTPEELLFSTASYSDTMESCAALAALAPCYISGLYGGADAIYYLPSGTNYTSSSNDARTTFVYSNIDGDYYAHLCQNSVVSVPAYAVGSQIYNIPAGETTYIHSTDRNAYPDSGTVDGLTYTYLGIPFENAVTAPRIATGSYTGTGLWGAGNENSITLDFEPKLLFVCRVSTYGEDMVNMYGAEVSFTGGLTYFDQFFWYEGLNSLKHYYSSGTAASLWFVKDGNTIKWRLKAKASNVQIANYQFNGSGETYAYVAIG